MKLANKVFSDLKKLDGQKYIHLIEPSGGMGHFKQTFLDGITQSIIDDSENDKCLLVISSIAEGNITRETLRDIHLLLDTHKISPKNVLLIQSNYNLQKQYDEMCELYGIKEKIDILIIQHKLESSVESYVQMMNGEWSDWESSFPKEPTINSWEDVEQILDKPRDYYYLSYNKTLRPDRVALLSLLLKDNLIEKGLVSVGSEKYGSIGHQPWPHDFHFIKDNLEEIQKWSTELRKLQPISPDGEPSVVDMAKANIQNLNTCGYTYGDQFRRVYFMVVTEDVLDADSMFFSQTTYKPIVSLTPFIMFGSPYMMKNLREVQGFKTFSPWIDESYDEEENHEKRLYMISEEVKRLCNIPKEKLNEWYIEMKDILIYNQNHLLNLKLSDYDKIYDLVYGKIFIK
tara:strand:- start:524 stop:1726 length:1203 start_codon:yes stop_codon:yes gene_type:complete